MTKPPGKTLCVGASYISLECAFFNTFRIRYNCIDENNRSRGFDRQCANKVVNLMKLSGTKFK